MKILLIQPRMHRRPMDTDLKTRMAPSLALLTLVALTPKEHAVTLVNENIENVDLTRDADFVGITVTLDVMPRACQIAEAFRGRGIPVAAGGVHVTCDPESYLSHFDALCVGPAERVWKTMLEDAERGRLRKVYRDMRDFRGEEIVSPAYSAIASGSYLYTNIVTTGRGCPNRCDFCYNSCENRLDVRRPVANVLKDIQTLKTRHILFVDDNFTGSADYARSLLEALRPYALWWSAAVTTRILDDPALLDLMAETGCRSLFVGFESINADSLRSVRKRNRVETYEKLVEELHGRGIMINASMVFGLDGDAPDVFQKTMDWLVAQKIETLTSHILTPYPGTALYRRMLAEGRVTDFDLAHYNTAHVVFTPARMTPEQLYAGYLWMYRRFYSFRNIARRLPRCRRQRAPYLLFNLLYRKFGRLTSLLAKGLPMRLLGRMGTRPSYHVK